MENSAGDQSKQSPPRSRQTASLFRAAQTEKASIRDDVSQLSTQELRSPAADNVFKVSGKAHEPSLGGEVPRGVYAVVLGGYAWLLVIAWIIFGGSVETDLALVVAATIWAMLLAIPVVASRMAFNHSIHPRLRRKRVRSAHLRTATGELAAREAYLQILIIPIALAIAATLFSIVYLVMS
jgi:hypothetical protein